MSRPRGDQRRRLRMLLAGVFTALLVPAGVLAWLGYRQIQYEAFYLQQTRAAELAQAIDRRAAAIFAAEDAHAFVDFGFLIVGEGNFVQRSPLSGFPAEGALPGLVSYFQVDADGAFSTPLLPADADAMGYEPEDRDARAALQDRIRVLLAGPGAPGEAEPLPVSEGPDRFASGLDADGQSTPEADAPTRRADLALDDVSAPVTAPEPESVTRDDTQLAEMRQGQRAFERLNAPREKTDSPLGRVSDLKLEERFTTAAGVSAAALPAAREVQENAEEPPADPGARSAPPGRRSEKSVAFAGDQLRGLASAASPVAVPEDQPLTIFESEVDPFRFELLDPGHFVLHRTAWRDGRRFVQGAVIERNAFVRELIAEPYRASALASSGSLAVAHLGAVLQTYSGPRAGSVGSISGTLLYRSRLTAPLSDIELVFGFSRLPAGPGGTLIGWTLAVFVGLLIAGFLLLYRLGLKQIALGEQQQDFVAAVSHELKTPLTSIRMYGEMLKAGWASEEKRRQYYDFIFSESERLTRLINNVLRLARFDRNGSDLDLRPITAGALLDLARSKIASQIEQAGFALEEYHEDPDAVLEADSDAFVQIAINLVDNALKFSAGADRRQIRLASRVVDGQVEFSVRDYGPGVPRSQMKKIFGLFYRTERELTRETVGTGIGLALVHDLAAAMGGSVDVRNTEPGAEFRVRLPLAGAPSG